MIFSNAYNYANTYLYFTDKKRRKTTDDSIRQLICKKYDAGKPICIISEDLDIPRKTVSSIIKIYKESGRMNSNSKYCGRKKSIQNECKDYIKDLIAEDCSITLRKIKGRILEDKGTNISLASIHRSISDFEFTFKKVDIIPVARNTESNVQKRYDYAREIMTLNFDDIIYVDEMGVNCSMRSRFGRSLVGTTPRKVVTTIRSQNISVGACVSKSGMLHKKVTVGSYNTLLFLDLLKEVICKLKEDCIALSKIFIMDNCSIHKNKCIKDVLEENGHRLIFLPPYTPQLNPIEEVFSLWKRKIRQANCSNREELLACIQSKFNEITTENCSSFYSHTQEFLAKAIAKEDF